MLKARLLLNNFKKQAKEQTFVNPKKLKAVVFFFVIGAATFPCSTFLTQIC